MRVSSNELFSNLSFSLILHFFPYPVMFVNRLTRLLVAGARPNQRDPFF